MKAILEFNLPEEKQEHNYAVNVTTNTPALFASVDGVIVNTLLSCDIVAVFANEPPVTA